MKVSCNNVLIDENCRIAKSFFSKLFGRIFLSDTLLIKNCNAIHTIFMRVYSDIIFLDKNNKVVKIYENVPPKCILFPQKDAKSVLEGNTGIINNAKIQVGNVLVFEDEG